MKIVEKVIFIVCIIYLTKSAFLKKGVFFWTKSAFLIKRATF